MKLLIKYFPHLVVSLTYLLIIKSQYFCFNKINDSDKFFSVDQIKNICLRIKNFKFIISIQKSPNNNNLPSEDIRRQFSLMCRPLNICKSGVMISIYVNSKKVTIYSGSDVKTSLSNQKKKQLILNEKSLLTKGDYYKSIMNMIDNIKTQIPMKMLNNYKFHANGSLKTKIRGVKNRKFSGMVIFLIIFSLICIGLCLIILIRSFSNEYKNENYNQKQFYNDNLKKHMDFLSKILYDFRRIPDKTLQINFCLMCMEDFSINKDSLNTTVRRFYCGHLFHFQCIKTFHECLMCKGLLNCTPNFNTPLANAEHNDLADNKSNEYKNYINVSNPFLFIITEREVVNFMQNLRDIYDDEELNYYYKQNTKEVENISKEHGISMWGLVAGIATGAVIGGLVGYGVGGYMNLGDEEHHYEENYRNKRLENFYDEEEEDDYNGDVAEEQW